MKAARVHRFGPPEAISLDDIATPAPARDEVLVRVKAAGVGPWDGWIRAGKSVVDQPLPLTLGSDLSGTIVAVGDDVRDLKPGQAVFGVTNARFTGAYAEYAAASAGMVGPKPAVLDDCNAAALPVVAVTAMQMVVDEANVSAGQRVLVHGAAGSLGALAVQMALRLGATVIGTVRGRGADYVRSLGVHQIIDTGAADFERGAAPVDTVIDTVGGPSQAQVMSVVKPGGILVSAVSAPDAGEASRRGVRAGFMLVRVTTAALGQVAALVEARKLTWRLGPALPLSQARQAHEMLEGLEPRPEGKIVLLP